jgi:SAM-dependent methyltransferase
MAGTDYYARKLSAERLRQVYAVAPPRVRRYLEAEIDFVASLLRGSDTVLELGCGYGRALRRLAEGVRSAVGIDTSPANIEAARSELAGCGNCRVLLMDAARTDFPDGGFDAVVCVQNGISAFRVDRTALVREALRVARSGAPAVFSSYAQRFWEHRLAWFRLQAEAGLLGPIDEERTGNGVIVCTDGFRSGTVGEEEFRRIAAALGADCETTEVDASSLFCVYRVPCQR